MNYYSITKLNIVILMTTSLDKRWAYKELAAMFGINLIK
jgi:hypothetical protein